MKYIWISIGFISLALGVIGIVFPILPTTPFLLLTAWCFAKGSSRFHNWFISTNLYKKHLEEFIKRKEMSLKKKIIILLPVSTMLLVLFYLTSSQHARIAIIVVIIIKYYYFIFKIKTVKEKR